MTQKIPAKAQYSCDPRLRLTAVLCLSTLSVCFNELISLLWLLAASLLFCLLFGAPLLTLVKQLRWLLPMFLLLALVQSLFNVDSEVLLQLGRLRLLTAYGLRQAGLFSLRILIVVSSACILLKESTRRLIQALSQMHMPFELVFMVSTAVRFMGVIRDEFRNSLHAIQLRGVDLQHIPLKQRMKVYSYLLLPVMTTTLSRARQLSLSVDLRGFRRSKQRISYFTLTLSLRDKLLIALFGLITLVILVLYYIKPF